MKLQEHFPRLGRFIGAFSRIDTLSLEDVNAAYSAKDGRDFLATVQKTIGNTPVARLDVCVYIVGDVQQYVS